MKILLPIALASLCVSLPAAAKDDPASDATTQPAAGKTAAADTKSKSDDDVVKCRKIAVTGSLITRRKVCKTIAEWRESSRSGNREARDMVDAANQGATSGK